jgi:hypothetical protein
MRQRSADRWRQVKTAKIQTETRLLADVLKFSPQFTSSVLFDQVINFAQT